MLFNRDFLLWSLSVNLYQTYNMEEVFFLVEESDEGGYTAKGLGVSIFTQAESLEELREMVKDAVACHFDDGLKRIIRLHIVREEIITA